jgi:hypothetical protein
MSVRALFIASGKRLFVACYILAPVVRASSAMDPARPLTSFFFFIRMAKKGPVVSPVPLCRPDLGLHPSGELRPSPVPRGVLGDSGRNKCVLNSEESSRASGGPDLSAREDGRRPHRIVFRVSSSSHASSSARYKSLPPTDVQPRGEAS